MYGYFDALIIFGFNIGDRDTIIDHQYLENVFPDISEYALDVVRTFLGEAAYGIMCALDKKTGQVTISDKDKDEVKKLHDKYVDYLKKNLTDKEFKEKMRLVELGFYLAVSGDYGSGNSKPIILEENWNEEGNVDGGANEK